MNTALLTPLTQLESSLTTLLSSLTTTNTFFNAPQATRDLISADDSLTTAINTLHRHQENYSRILQLRAEAERLQTELRGIVRQCGELRREVGEINPRILEYSSDEDEDEDDQVKGEETPSYSTTTKTKKRRVDYETLLAFAARIGRHNAAAAREADRDSQRRRVEIDAKRKRTEPGHHQEQNLLNGTFDTTFTTSTTVDTAVEDTQDTTMLTTATATTTQQSNITQESQVEIAAINDTLAAQRAYNGTAFPAAETLRMGVLGQLQLIREQEGDDGVDREIERMMRETENVTTGSGGAVGDRKTGSESMDVDVKAGDGGQGERSETVERLAQPRPVPSEARPAVVPQPPAPRKKLELDLDFPDSDDDDDDED